MSPLRIKRDRVLFKCSNCKTKARSRPDNQLNCGQCCLPLIPQYPANYPQAQKSPRPNPMKLEVWEIPLDEFAIPAHVRDLLNQIHADAPEPAVVRQPEPQKPKKPAEPKRKGALPEKVVAEADRIILACLKADAENGVKRSGWKLQLAQKLDRHPAWVTVRIKKVQAAAQAAAA